MSRKELRDIVAASSNIVFFGGAGTSTESGIPDFRSADGLYESGTGGSVAPEEILSRDFFLQHTKEFYSFYKSKMIYPDAQPNPAHHALAELEKRGQLKAVITQNIDGLHQMAGSQNVLELHGSVHRNYCMDCGKAHDLDYVLHSELVPYCSCGGVVKPDVVLYQENLDHSILQRSIEYISQAEVLIVAGTSLTVHPAAGLVRYYTGNHFVIINKTPTPYDTHANLVIHDSVGKVLSDLIEDGE